MPADGLHRSRPALARRPPLRSRMFRAGGWLFVGGALIVTFSAFFLIGMRVANRARDVAVPDLRGLATSQAQTAAAAVGLDVRIDQRRADRRVPVGHVIDQEPAAGSNLRRNRTVRLYVSDGQQDPVVPSVVGQVVRTAEIILTGDQIGVGRRAEISSGDYASDVVIAQDPPALAQAAEVALLVNRGESGGGFVMPDVIGAIGGRAVDVLRRRGFRVTVSGEVPYPGLPSGVVVRQTPQPGFQIGPGETIVLEVSQ